MFMSVVDSRFVQSTPSIISARWREINEADFDSPLGQADIGEGAIETLGFLITNHAVSGAGVLGCTPLELPNGGWALRVDEVAFPVGAIAHQHTHTGSGWRHLVGGALRIEAEHGEDVMNVGASWFEPANSPVRAVALQSEGVTRFVRCMVIPMADVGRSTYHLCAPEDAILPRLQVTHRHIDHIVQVDAG